MKPAKPRRGWSLRPLGRVFWLGLLASLLLHALLISSGRFQLPHLADPPVLEARLELTEPRPAAPKPLPRPARKPVPAPPPNEAANRSLPESPPPEAALPEAESPPAPESLSAPAPTPAEIGAQAQPYAALTQAAEGIRQLPSHIEIVYQLKGLLSGKQTHVWQQTGGRYTLTAEAEATGLAGLFVRGKMLQQSQGRIGSLGLMPERYESQRPGGKKEILRFDYAANLIESTRIDEKHGERKLELPMLSGVQDPLSAIYQLAMAARADQDGLLVAASAKRVKGYPYRTLGKESLSTALGRLETVHVARTGDTDKGAVHLWLSPQYHYLPVKVSYVDDDGSAWVLEAVSLSAR